MDNEKDVEHLVSQLDAMVSKEGAYVQLMQYGGGPDESQVLANKRGYLRLGIEFLKGGVIPFLRAKDKETQALDLDISYLLTDDSDVGFDSFYRIENRATEVLAGPTLKDRLVEILIGAVFILFVVLAVIGFVVVIGKIF